MRFKIHLQSLSKQPTVLPINYQYPLSAWIYKTIHDGDNEFAQWLHNQGYFDNKRQYKLFTFSQLSIDKFKVVNDRLIIRNPELSVTVSFYAEQAAEPFIKGLFKDQKGSIGDQRSKTTFQVSKIEKLNDPRFENSLILKTLSPIIVAKTPDDNSKNAIFLSPESPSFPQILYNNLINKKTAWMINSKRHPASMDFEKENGFRFNLLNKPKPRLVTIKAGTPQETKVKGYIFNFQIKAPSQLLEIGYHAGFGEKNSLGFGCVEVDK